MARKSWTSSSIQTTVMKSKMFIPKAGDIVAWNNESKCTSIAVMMNEDEFSVCLNFRGRKDEESRVWEWDNVPTNKTLRRADKLEMAWLFAELIVQGYEFRAEDGKVTVRTDNEAQTDNDDEPDNSTADISEQPVTMHVECVFLTRNQRFAKYVYELALLYKQKGSFRQMSELSRSNNISSIRKETCFRIGLHELKDPEWLKTNNGRVFCDSLYEYALHHTSQLPVVPNSQRR